MVVDDLDAFGVRAIPSKANAELIVDADAVLSRPIALECLEPIAGRYAQKVQRCRRMNLFQLASCDALDCAKSAYGRPLEQSLRFRAAERYDCHAI